MSTHRDLRLLAPSKSRLCEPHTCSRAYAATSTTDQSSHRAHSSNQGLTGAGIGRHNTFRRPWSSRSPRSCTQLVGCGAFETEKLQVGGNQLEQHVAADLNRAALVLGCLQERGDVGVEHHI